MRINFINESELEFGEGGSHVDVRFGIMQHGPLDRGSPIAPKRLKVGIVGTDKTIEGIRNWLERCARGIEAKESRLSKLFPPFPGFSDQSCFGAALVFHERWLASIHKREIDDLIMSSQAGQIVSNAVSLFLDYAEDLTEQGGPMVIICAPPRELLAAMESSDSDAEDSIDQEIDESYEPVGVQFKGPHFHDLLKARGMRLNVPIQMVRPDTYEDKRRHAKKKGIKRDRILQDEATRAWNFHTALYYKAGGIPWRLIRNPAELSSLFVGVSFYRSLEGDRMLTSLAQVFNERGEGVIVKGAPARFDKEDKQHHLSAQDSDMLLKIAITTYRKEHKTLPARIVVHKTSKINEEESEGFRNAAQDEKIDSIELLSMRRSFSRLFRLGTYPPLRGTFLELDEQVGLLYLRGSVNFFETYPGLYVPRPLEFSIFDANTTMLKLAEEIFSLSKLNWNNTQFDGGEPITVRAARRVGDIIKCVPDEEEDILKPSYRFFM